MNLSFIRLFLIAGGFTNLIFPSQTLAQQIVKTDTSSYSTIRIDPSSAMGAEVSDIFSMVDYIPLETTSESILGKISQLEILDSHFVVLDYDKNSIFIFNNQGKFRARIKGKDNGRIIKFLVNKWTSQIVYTSDNYQTMTYCNLDGKVVKTDKNMDTSGIPIIYLNSYFISKDQLISYDQYRNIDTLSKYYRPYSRSLLRFGNPIHSVGLTYTLAETKIDVLSSGIGPLTTYGSDTTFFLAKPYDYTIYVVTPHAIRLAYKFIFPQTLSLPVDFLTNPVYDLKRITFIQKNRDLIFSLNNCYQIGSNLFFEASPHGSSKEDNLIYNLKSGNLIAYKHILPDEVSCFLPIYDNITSNFENLGLAHCDGTFLYTSLSSLCMFKAKDENKDKKILYTDLLKTYFEKNNAKSNPVILRLKPKAEF